jgi:solute carrier family 6 dopamine transporter-like protein 3
MHKRMRFFQVVTSGITLAFVTYPSAFLEMVVPPLWSFLFFLMLVNLAMSGLTASNQVIVSYITDEWPRLGSYQTTISVLIPAFCFLCGLPFTCNAGIHLFTLIDQRGSVSLLGVAIMQVSAFVRENFCNRNTKATCPTSAS